MRSVQVFEAFQKDFVPGYPLIGDGKTIVLYGPPCSGKTTLSKLIADRYKLHRLSLDALRKSFNGKELFTNKNNSEVLKLFLDELRFLHERRQSVICEGFFFSAERKKQLIDAVNGDEVLFIYLTADLEVLKERLAKRIIIGDNLEGNPAEPLTFLKLKEFYDKFHPCNYTDLKINTENSTAIVIEKKIIDYIENAFDLTAENKG